MGNKKETPQRQYSGHHTILGHYTDRDPIGLGQYDSLGEYCGPHTVSSVVLILTCQGFKHFLSAITSWCYAATLPGPGPPPLPGSAWRPLGVWGVGSPPSQAWRCAPRPPSRRGSVPPGTPSPRLLLWP